MCDFNCYYGYHHHYRYYHSYHHRHYHHRYRHRLHNHYYYLHRHQLCIGAIMILDSTSLAIIREERKSKQAITDIKFGPLTSGIMAVASSDGRVYIHGTKKFELLRTIETPVKNCGITKIDFTMDGIILRMCTNFNQLFYYNLEGSGSIMSNASFLRDKTWLQPSAIFTWESQGKCIIYT